MSYEEHVLKHYAEPFQKGPSPGRGWVHVGEAVSDVCGDKVTMMSVIEKGKLVTMMSVIEKGKLDIWWEGEGCCFSMAAASMLVEYAKDMTIQFMRGFTEDDMIELFQADFPSARRSCVLVAWNALQKLLETIA